MTVRDLLTMTSGITPDWNMRNLTPDWIRAFLAKPVKTPGKKFEYDSISTYMLSAIVQKVTGMTVLDYLKQKLFTPMHITDVAWEISPEGINTGGWGLHIERVVGKIRIVAAEPGCLGRQAVASGFLGGADDDRTDRRLWLSDVALRISGCCTC